MIQQTVLKINTPGRCLTNITHEIVDYLQQCLVTQGLCNVFIQHTSASLIISENADPDVCDDLEAFISRLIPDGDPLFKHDAEGDDDMPAHVRSVLTQTSLQIPINNGRLTLGTWQGVYLWEHRYANHTRNVVVTIIGD